MSDKNKPIILVTNDDGIHAPGIRALIEAVKPLGQVVVVAPDKPQSGMGHAITLNDPLRLKKVDIFGDIEAYSCNLFRYNECCCGSKYRRNSRGWFFIVEFCSGC